MSLTPSDGRSIAVGTISSVVAALIITIGGRILGLWDEAAAALGGLVYLYLLVLVVGGWFFVLFTFMMRNAKATAKVQGFTDVQKLRLGV